MLFLTLFSPVKIQTHLQMPPCKNDLAKSTSHTRKRSRRNEDSQDFEVVHHEYEDEMKSDEN